MRLEWPFKAFSKPSKPVSRPPSFFSPFPRSLSLLLAVILAVFYTVLLSACSDDSSTPTSSQNDDLPGGPLVIGDAGNFQNGNHFIAFTLAPNINSTDYTGDPTTNSFKIVLKKSTDPAPSRQEILAGAGIVRYPHTNEGSVGYVDMAAANQNIPYSNRMSIIAYDIDSEISNFITEIRDNTNITYPRRIYHTDVFDSSQYEIPHQSKLLNSYLLAMNTEYTIYAVQINAESPVYQLGKRTTSGLDVLEQVTSDDPRNWESEFHMFAPRAGKAIVVNKADSAFLMPGLFRYEGERGHPTTSYSNGYVFNSLVSSYAVENKSITTNLYTMRDTIKGGYPKYSGSGMILDALTAVLYPSPYFHYPQKNPIFRHDFRSYNGYLSLFAPDKLPSGMLEKEFKFAADRESEEVTVRFKLQYPIIVE